MGFGDAEVRMTTSLRSGGGDAALHLKVAGVDLYVLRTSDRNDGSKNAGQIVYKGCPDEEFRNKVRDCLSFIFGKPIVYLGYTAYCAEWHPTFMKSVDAFSIGGAMFRLHSEPPYPINDNWRRNRIDQNQVGIMVNALIEKYDVLRLNEICWIYWYAVCAPLHASAIHFGSLIEHLQRKAVNLVATKPSKLLDDGVWQSLRGTLKHWLNEQNVNPQLRAILEGKISSLNQAPQSLVFTRMLEAMGLKITDAEIQAWKHRNMAAHGGVSDNQFELIVNRHLLRILFHRLLAGVTYCSDRYVDRYNLNHPIRPVTEGVPAR
jgi:hypothetical protein